jgi:Ca-activated chloride channel family protein
MPAPGAIVPEDGTIGEVSLRYRVPGTMDEVVQSRPVVSPLGPDATGYFSADSAEKGFVMLNLYVAFEMAAQRATVGDDTTALGLLLNVRTGVDAWLATHDDYDIADDLRYVDMFIDNLYARGASEPPPQANPPEPWPAD